MIQEQDKNEKVDNIQTLSKAAIRANLISYNSSPKSVPMDFNLTGNLSVPILGASEVAVTRFNIPANNIPMMIWVNDVHHFTLKYGAFSYTIAVNYIDLGGKDGTVMNIYEISNFTLMCNTALSTAVTQLNILASGTLPSTIAPRITYDSLNSLFGVVAPTVGYDEAIVNKITLEMDEELWIIFQSLPTYYTYSTSLYRFIFYNIPENVYLTNYLKITQECITTSNFTIAKSIVITTSLPIQSELVCDIGGSTGQTLANIISQFNLNYDTGTRLIYTDIRYVAPSEHYRFSHITSNAIYDLKCQVYYLDSHGLSHPMLQAPDSVASILLEFR